MKFLTDRILSGTLLCSAAILLFAACSKDHNEEPGPVPVDTSLFKGSDISSAAGIYSDAETKVSSIEIYKNGNWAAYSLSNTKSPDFEKPVLKRYYAGSYALAYNAYTQYCIEWEDSRAVVAPRQLPIECQKNLRDLGGYKTKDGRYVKWGLLFRSGKLDELTDSDLDYLASIPVKTVIDFRNHSEIASAPDKLPPTVVNTKNYNVLEGDTSVDDFMDSMNQGRYDYVRETMILSNEIFVREHQEVFKAYLSDILNENNLPLLFHCTGGKDRAGFASALFLSALGSIKRPF